MLYLGLPRVVASVMKGPGFSTLLAANDGAIQDDRQLASAVNYLEAAAKWEESGRLLTEVGFLQLVRAAEVDLEESRSKELAAEASRTLREGLLRSPARPYSWVRLAYARAMEGAEPQEVVALLEQSYEVGGFVGAATFARLELLLSFWEDVPPALRSLAAEQIRYAWKNEPRSVIEAARFSDKPEVYLNAIASLPGALDQFEAALPAP